MSTVLKDEINADPLGRGYSGMSAQQIADDLNTEYRTKVGAIPSDELLAWAAQGASDDGPGKKSRIELIKLAAERSIPGLGNPNRTTGLSMAADIMIFRSDTDLDMSDPTRIGMVDALVADGIFTAEDKTELEAMATTLISRAAELEIGRVKVGHVLEAQAVQVP